MCKANRMTETRRMSEGRRMSEASKMSSEQTWVWLELLSFGLGQVLLEFCPISPLYLFNSQVLDLSLLHASWIIFILKTPSSVRSSFFCCWVQQFSYQIYFSLTSQSEDIRLQNERLKHLESPEELPHNLRYEVYVFK